MSKFVPAERGLETGSRPLVELVARVARPLEHRGLDADVAEGCAVVVDQRQRWVGGLAGGRSRGRVGGCAVASYQGCLPFFEVLQADVER